MLGCTRGEAAHHLEPDALEAHRRAVDEYLEVPDRAPLPAAQAGPPEQPVRTVLQVRTVSLSLSGVLAVLI